jgi:uncharacterized membrane protein YqgA involved in biofilm formation
MKKETQNTIMVCSAVGMLIVGVSLNIAGFIVPPTGEISNSVLWVLAQSLIYAGSVFGVKSYIDTKVDDVKRKISDKNPHNSTTFL